MVGGSVALLWVALGWPILRIFFGSEFLSAYPPLVVLLPGLLALGLQRVCGAAILREGKPARMALIYAVGLMVNVGLNLILIPMLGIVGAALSSSVSYSLGALLFLKWTASIAGKPMVEGVVPTRDDIRSLRRSLLELAVSIGPALRGRE
jgi:O-antigen/teichoic acid export membrane protein